MENCSSSSNWSDLPIGVMNDIGDKVLSSCCIADFIRFRSVCSSWRSATDITANESSSSSSSSSGIIVVLSKLPWLMIPYPLTLSDHDTRQFFCLASDTITTHHHRLYLPELCNADCHGLNISSWLLVTCKGSETLPFLFNPLTRSQIFLPQFPTFTDWQHRDYDDDDDNEEDLEEEEEEEEEYEEEEEEEEYEEEEEEEEDEDEDEDEEEEEEEEDANSNFLINHQFYAPSISLAVLSSDPSTSSSFEIMVIHGQDWRLAFCRPGDAKWTDVLNRDSWLPCRKFVALAYSNCLFYAIDSDDNLFVCDLNVSPPTATLVTSLPERPKDCSTCYLVGSDKELLLIIRIWGRKNVGKFHVYQLVDEKETEVEKKKDEQVAVEEEDSQEEEEMEEDLEGLLFSGMDILEDEEEEEEVKGEEGKWRRMHSIGERAIFLCNENSVLISTVGLVKCAWSCIYYYDVFSEPNYPETYAKLVEFSLHENKCKRMIQCSPLHSVRMGQPLFLQPSLLLRRNVL